MTRAARDSTASTACGKVLLFGEHAVVHGAPAIALGLPEGARAQAELTGGGVASSRLVAPAWALDLALDDPDQELARALAALLDALGATRGVRVTFELGLPAGVGLGSSAAIGIAAARACIGCLTPGIVPDLARLIELGYAWEGVFHGTPSGIDHTAAARGGAFVFERTPAGPRITPIALADALHLVVAVAGPASSTREMVAAVTERVERDPACRAAVDEIGDLVRSANAILERDVDPSALGSLMARNHELLQLLGVSTPGLDHACRVALEAGASGAKVTGAGGGGCIVALARDPSAAEHVAAALQSCCEEVLCRTLSP